MCRAVEGVLKNSFGKRLLSEKKKVLFQLKRAFICGKNDQIHFTTILKDVSVSKQGRAARCLSSTNKAEDFKSFVR